MTFAMLELSGVIPGVAETYVAQIDIPPRAYEVREIEGAAEEDAGKGSCVPPVIMSA